MSIALECPACQNKLKAKSTAAGGKVKCPACGAAVPVPTETANSTAAAESANPFDFENMPAHVDTEQDKQERKEREELRNAMNAEPVLPLVLQALALLCFAASLVLAGLWNFANLHFVERWETAQFIVFGIGIAGIVLQVIRYFAGRRSIDPE
jgi:DNA-directed RNA polymerase subunit M/transcription elongation factor TFIIS